jgi:hypothetical protein
MKFIEDVEDFEEASRVREVLGWTVEQKDPYGFFYFVQKGKKPIPEELSGAYTTVYKVEDAIKHYESLKPKNAP